MDATQLASYGLGGVGLLIAAVAGWPLLSNRINTGAANAQLVKLASANNLDRLVKLCSAAPGTYLDAVKAGALAATATGSDDAVRVETAVREAFDPIGDTLARRWRSRTERGLAGVIVAGGGVGLALSAAPLSAPIAILGGVAVLVGLFLLARRGYMDQALALCRTDVLPAIVRAGALDPTPRRATRASAPAATPATPGEAATGRTLRDGTCPLCEHTAIRTLSRGDDRFTTYVCEGCGYSQEFADPARLDR